MQATGSHCNLIVNNAIAERFLVNQPLSDWFHLTSQSRNTPPPAWHVVVSRPIWVTTIEQFVHDVLRETAIVLMFSWLFGGIICCLKYLSICSHLFVANSAFWFLIMCLFFFVVSWYLLKMTLSSCVLCALFSSNCFLFLFFSFKPVIHPNVNNVKTSLTPCFQSAI